MSRFLRGLTAFLLAASLIIPAAMAEYVGIGKTTDNLRLRKEASLSSAVITVAPKGESVTVTQKSIISNADGAWYAVTYNGQSGYMSADYLTVAEDGETVSTGGYINASYVNLRSKPNTDSAVISVLNKNTKLEITGTQDGWYAVRCGDTDGFVRCDLVSLGEPSSAPAAAAASAAVSKDYSIATSTLDSVGTTDAQRNITDNAVTLLGKPYVYGASGPNSFDCSGFTSYVYKQSGYSIQRTATDQYRINGKGVSSKADLLPGDLVFFKDPKVSSKPITHVGIYIGNGNFIHAGSGSSGAGKCVKISNLNSGYYANVYYGAKRVV